MASTPTGTSGALYLTLSIVSSNAATRTYVIRAVAQIACSNSATYINGGSWSIGPWGVGGSFSLDGVQTITVFNGTTTVQLDAAGNASTISETFTMGATGTSGLGGPTSVAASLYLPALKVAPGTPTGVTATRVSDTQVSVSWSQSSASNGQPASDTIQRSVNGGDWETVATVSATTSATVAASANQKIQYRVRGNNSAGSSAWSSASAAVYTTPAAPTAVTATKNDDLDIVVSWTPHVAFSEHDHVIVHGVVSDGSTTWDSTPLATVAAGTSTYTHDSPDASDVHIYKVYAQNLDTTALASAAVTSNSVQLLVAPNKPGLPDVPAYADKGKAFTFAWVHNPVDTTAQTAYEVGYSTDGGSTWDTTGKTTSTTESKTFPADSYDADDQLTLRVRTWGQADSGGSDGTGASPWSEQATVTFKTRPTVTIDSPVSATAYTRSALNVQLSFSQAEGASFVSASIELSQDSTVLEQRDSTTLASTVMETRVENSASYTVKVTVTDSNGLTSDAATVTFDVEYTEPVAAGVELTYLSDSGIAQIDITIPTPGTGEVAAVSVTITRTISGATETVVAEYPAAAAITILDTTPTIHGDNDYVVTTLSEDGASTTVTKTLTTAEEEWAFLSGGSGFAQIVAFGGELKPQSSPTVDSALVKTAGRARPIGLYGRSGGLVVSGTGEIVAGIGSTAEEIEAHLLIPGKHCYRDPSGRRMFGLVTGQVSRDTYNLGSFSYTVTETS